MKPPGAIALLVAALAASGCNTDTAGDCQPGSADCADAATIAGDGAAATDADNHLDRGLTDARIGAADLRHDAAVADLRAMDLSPPARDLAVPRDAAVAKDAAGDDAAPGCRAAEGTCSDHLDDDGDGLIDCLDPDCGDDPACIPPIAPGSYALAGGDSRDSDPYALELHADGTCRWSTSSLPVVWNTCTWVYTAGVAGASSTLVISGGGQIAFSWPVQRHGDVLVLSVPAEFRSFDLALPTSLSGTTGPKTCYRLGQLDDGADYSANSYTQLVGWTIDLKAGDQLVAISNDTTWVRGPMTATDAGPVLTAPGTTLAGHAVAAVAPASGTYLVLGSLSSSFGTFRAHRFNAAGRPYHFLFGNGTELDPYTGEAAAVGDVTGDGRADVLVADGCHLNVFPQLANGTLGPAQSYVIGSVCPNYSATDIFVVDLNQDGKDDVVLQVEGAPVSLLQGANGALLPAVTGPYASGPFPRAAILNVNGDAIPDLALVGIGNVTVYIGDGKGAFTISRTLTASTMGYHAFFAADLDHDGKDDVLTVSGQGNGPNISYFSGADLPERTYTLATPQLAPGDFSCQGQTELAWSGGQILRLDAQYQFQNVEPLQTYLGDEPRAVDLDHDGRLEVVSVSEGVRVASRREGKWVAANYGFPTALNYNPNQLAVGDFTGDGCPDVVVECSNLGAVVMPGLCP